MTCIACGGSRRIIAATRNGFNLLRCGQCALVSCSPMPTPAELDSYYQGFAYAKPDASQLARQLDYTEAGTRRLTKEIEELARRPIRTVLDFGGGLGFFAGALSRQYADVTLFDLDSHAREFARAQFPGRFRVVEDSEQALATKYDLILLNQVIEHVPDPVAFLHSFVGALEPGGLLVVTTSNNNAVDTLTRPDVLWHYARLVDLPMINAIRLLISDSWACCDPPRHLYSFNPTNLVLIADRAGLAHRRTSTSFFDQDPLGQPKYGLRGIRSVRSSVETLLFLISKITAWINRALDRGKQKGSTLTAWFSTSLE